VLDSYLPEVGMLEDGDLSSQVSSVPITWGVRWSTSETYTSTQQGELMVRKTHWIEKWRGILWLWDSELCQVGVFLCSQKWLFLGGQNNRFSKACVCFWLFRKKLWMFNI